MGQELCRMSLKLGSFLCFSHGETGGRSLGEEDHRGNSHPSIINVYVFNMITDLRLCFNEWIRIMCRCSFNIPH